MTSLELNGITHELKFWQGFVKTRRFLDGWVAPIRTPELHQETYDFIKSVPHEKVLDVGSGVCSILNGTVPNVIPMDPLGGLYELIFDYKKYNLPVPHPIPAEELAYPEVLSCDPRQYFDIVHISNALDHTQDPAEAVKAMYTAVKPGGFLIIQGFENEGSFENWQGFHQWDIYVNNNNELVYNYKDLGDPPSVLLSRPFKLFRKPLNDKSWYIWIQQKQ